MIRADLCDYPQSKLGPPWPARAGVARARLLAKLEDEAPLVLVVAPAGSGKTALLASWIAARHASTEPPLFVWYGIDQDDREPGRLVDGLAAAVEHALPGAGLPARRALARGAGVFAALAMLLAALERRTSVVLILDDCHCLDGARAAEAPIEYLARHRPPCLRLVLSSRGIPLLPALASVAAGELHAIGRDDLQFNPDETRALLASHDLAPEEATDLVSPVRGWAMGLLLLAHAKAGKIAFLRQPEEALGRYLMAQVVEGLPTSLRTFLLESAVLSPFTAAEADRILERRDSRRQIEAIVG